jgi:hypothetical protein
VYRAVRALRAADSVDRRLELVNQSRSVHFLWLFMREPNYEEISSLPEREALEQAARRRILEIARSDPDPRQREWAIGDIHVNVPNELLRELAQTDPDASVRKAAKERLARELTPRWSQEDASELARMAKSADRETRAAAVGRLEDVKLLSEIAQKDPDAGIREDAVDKLADHAEESQAVLARVAEKDKEERVRSAAAALVTDPKALERLLRTSRVASVRLHALQNLEGKAVDPSLLLWVVEHDDDDEIRHEAASQIKDPKVLARLATSSSSSSVRASATARLNDQKLLGEIAVRDSDEWVYIAAIKALKDEAVVLDVVRRRRDEHVLELVARQTNSQAALVEILRLSKQSIPRAVAAGKLTDRALLTQLANDPDGIVRNAATRRLKEQF